MGRRSVFRISIQFFIVILSLAVSVTAAFGIIVLPSYDQQCQSPFIEDFGTGTGFARWPSIDALADYSFENGALCGDPTGQSPCPCMVDDNQYMVTNDLSAIVPGASCFGQGLPPFWPWWLKSGVDHTAGDTNGRMLVINAAFRPGYFFNELVTGLVDGAQYSFFAWIGTICAQSPITSGNPIACTIPSNVAFEIWSPTGILIQTVNTGNIPQPNNGNYFQGINWFQFGMTFTAAASIQTFPSVILRMRNNGGGGDGNDLVIDDITFRASCDFGDAPESYGTSFAGSGNPAVHLTNTDQQYNVILDGSVDPEPDGQPGAGAVRDGADEDGVSIPATMTPGSTVSVGVTVSGQIAATAGGYVNAWFDWNQNGIFEAGEQVITDQFGANTTLSIPVTVSSNAVIGDTYARFRVCSASGECNTPTGITRNGEVEDYMVVIVQPEIHPEIKIDKSVKAN